MRSEVAYPAPSPPASRGYNRVRKLTYSWFHNVWGGVTKPSRIFRASKGRMMHVNICRRNPLKFGITYPVFRKARVPRRIHGAGPSWLYSKTWHLL